MSPDGMGWSWDELSNTPPYVRRFCLDLLNIKRRVHAEAMERARNAHGG